MTRRRRPRSPPDLEFFNGLGGFAKDGREYVTILNPGQLASGAVDQRDRQSRLRFPGRGGRQRLYLVAGNSRENQLTPWSNDPVTDRPGEAIYVRDEETESSGVPTALPIRDEADTYIARHGQGYSRFEHAAHGIALDLLQYVPLDDPIKISRLTLRNTVRARAAAVGHGLRRMGVGPVPQRLRAVHRSRRSIRRPGRYSRAIPGTRLSAAASRSPTWAGVRRRGPRTGANFSGGTDARKPAALAPGAAVAKRVGAGLDPCAALQTLDRSRPGRKRRDRILPRRGGATRRRRGR